MIFERVSYDLPSSPYCVHLILSIMARDRGCQVLAVWLSLNLMDSQVGRALRLELGRGAGRHGLDLRRGLWRHRPDPAASGTGGVQGLRKAGSRHPVDGRDDFSAAGVVRGSESGRAAVVGHGSPKTLLRRSLIIPEYKT